MLDKINSRKFFTEKNLKITIIDEYNSKNIELISEISQKFNDKDYYVELITDMKNNYVGNSSDILISFTDNCDLDNLIAREDIVKVIFDNGNINTDNYDIVVSFNDVKSDAKHYIKVENDFAPEFIEKLEKIILDGYEF